MNGRDLLEEMRRIDDTIRNERRAMGLTRQPSVIPAWLWDALEERGDPVFVRLRDAGEIVRVDWRDR